MPRLLMFALLSSFCLISSCSESNDPNYSKEIEGKLPAQLVHNPNSLKPTSGETGHLTFMDTLHNFGKLKEGEKVTYDFSYKNTGSKDVLIFSARASCGCTIPEYNSTTPIKPGEEGSIKVTFNSDGKKGHNHKTIVVNNSGIPGEVEIAIEAEVE